MSEDEYKKDTSVIPKGYYCYSYDKNGNQVNCPYWRVIKDRTEQENGWCDYLGEGDLEINQDTEQYDPKTGEVSEPVIPVGLLWDQVKECNINMYSDEEFEKRIMQGQFEVVECAKTIKMPNKNESLILRRKSNAK